MPDAILLAPIRLSHVPSTSATLTAPCAKFLPGKSAGEIGLYFDPAQHAISRKMNGILLLGDAIIGNPPGALSLIPEPKLDDSSKLKRSLRKLLDYDFNVLLLCNGQLVLSGGKLKVAEFLNALGG